MGMEMKLQFKLSQQLVMTPQLVQAIRLLQLSRLELVDEVRKELDGNPVLADDTTDPKARDGADKSMPAPSTNELPPEERIGITDRVEPDTDRALYCYTSKCVYDEAWTDITVLARGLILDLADRRIVATPFPKFFNIGEGGRTIPDLPFETFEKLDGSLADCITSRTLEFMRRDQPPPNGGSTTTGQIHKRTCAFTS